MTTAYFSSNSLILVYHLGMGGAMTTIDENVIDEIPVYHLGMGGAMTTQR